MPDVGLKKLKRENLTVIEAPGSDGGGASGSASGSTAPPPGGASGEGADGQWATGGEEQEMLDAFQDCMPLFHDACWGVTKLDIEFTLDRVVHKVLKDMSISKAHRRQRASALLKLGDLLKEPMVERRKQAKLAALEAPDAAAVAGSEEAQDRPLSPASQATAASTTSKRTLLARFKPRAPWKSNPEKKVLKAKVANEKQKRMEAAFAMMAAGASTEDVDDMVAARAAMEAEFGPNGGGGF
mmetsp:Transcript_146090/g.468565  ORF Transcript_146090/g.468565 Transcript_146090/m.468565 type:complete len:241 (-) Transcript_146090:104-826(-)